MSVASKLLERLVARQVTDYIQLNSLLPDRQSAYRNHSSTETAVLRVLGNLEAVDERDVAVLTLLDLSAAFDTVDHCILLQRLQISFGFDGPALQWFSYLSAVRRGSQQSAVTAVLCGIPQESVLRPTLFLSCTHRTW